jgi:hypothetical protein
MSCYSVPRHRLVHAYQALLKFCSQDPRPEAKQAVSQADRLLGAYDPRNDWMCWHSEEPPPRRAFALVLGGSYGTVPAVAQWEPKLKRWCEERGFSYPQSAGVQWHPLPDHPAFDPKTHFTESSND